jgi:hypothetical protein
VMCCIIKYTTFLSLQVEINSIFERNKRKFFHRLTLVAILPQKT